MKVQTLFAAALAVGIAGSAQAGTQVQLDINGLTATASGTFGTSFTGTLTLATDANSGLFGMLKNGNSIGIGFGGPYTGANHLFSASFTFNAGAITGIGFTSSLSSAHNSVLDNVYNANVLPGAGNILNDPGKPGSFIVAAATNGGVFNASSYGGVDVSEFLGNNLPGNFLNFKIDGGKINSGTKVDNDVDIDIFVNTNVIPLPTPIGMASVGLIALGAIRRRRN